MIAETIKQLEAQRAKSAKEVAALDVAIGALSGIVGGTAKVAAAHAPAAKRPTPVPAAKAHKPQPAAKPAAPAKAAKPAPAKKPKPQISAEGIEKIRAAQKARWAKIKAEKSAAPAAA